jgi:tripartite-type tricarboxylate transporter receptor subunit TctC
MTMIRALVLAMAGLLPTVFGAQAQDWPSRTVRIVNTFSAGATSDVLARIAAEHLTTTLHQQFYVESKPGAGGAVAIRTITTAPADGYNFVLTSAGQIVVAPIMNPTLTYDPLRELVHVAFLAGSPTVISISPRLGIRTLKELIDHAKKQAHPITFSSAGVGSSGQLVAQAFANQAGIEIKHVPYKGAAQSLMDVVSGHVTFSAQTVSSSASQIASGALIPLAQSGTERLAEYPNVPTFQELGLGDATGLTWFALSARAGLPQDILMKVNREVIAAMNKPETLARIGAQGMQTQNLSPEDLRKSIERETAHWRPVIERAGMIGN